MITSRLPAYRLTRLPVWALLMLVFLRPIDLSATTNDLSRLLQQGLFEEEANHNLEAAAQAYQSVVSSFDQDRKLAATAIFRLGEVYRKQGKTNEARPYYERVVREFEDQKVIVQAARQYLPQTAPTPTQIFRALPPTMTSTVLVDNRQASFSGIWRAAGVAKDRYGDDYLFASTITSNQVSQGLSKASFRPEVPTTGKYHVEIWYPGGENRSTNAQWKIYSGEEQDLPTIKVNQRVNGGKWLRIAEDVHFVKGSATITLSNVTGETNAVVVADAVRIVPADDNLIKEIAAHAPAIPSARPDIGIADNPFATFTGTWALAIAATNKWGADYRFATSTAVEKSATATFTPHFNSAGEYYVEIWFTEGQNRSRTVPVTIHDAKGSKTVPVDQSKSGGQWVRVHDEPFHLEPGKEAFVQISNNTGRTGEVVIADAVRYLPVDMSTSSGERKNLLELARAFHWQTISLNAEIWQTEYELKNIRKQRVSETDERKLANIDQRIDELQTELKAGQSKFQDNLKSFTKLHGLTEEEAEAIKYGSGTLSSTPVMPTTTPPPLEPVTPRGPISTIPTIPPPPTRTLRLPPNQEPRPSDP